METYFNEETVADLDFTGLSENAQRFIERRFGMVRSKRVRFSAFDHKINLCLISNVEVNDDVEDVKDKKLKKLLKSNQVLRQIFTALSKYQHYIKVNLSACSVILQENGELRFLTAHKSNFLLLDYAYDIKQYSDIGGFIFLLHENDLLNPEKFFLSDSKSRRLVSPCLALHLACIPGLLLTGGRPTSIPLSWQTPKSTLKYRKKNNVTKIRGKYKCTKCGIPFQSDIKHKKGPDNKMVCPRPTSASTSGN